MQVRVRYMQRNRVAIQADCAATAAATYWEFERQALQAVDSSGLKNGLNRLRTKGSWVQILPGAPNPKGQPSLALFIGLNKYHTQIAYVRRLRIIAL